MKITKEKLNQIIQEELSALAEEDAEIAAALMGKNNENNKRKT